MSALEELEEISEELEELQALHHELISEGAEIRELYSKFPQLWVDQVLGEHAWSKQVQILESVRDNKRTVVPSCHGAGKSFISARAMGWWLDIHPVNALVVTTAPTGYQVRDILWQEAQTVHAHGKLRGHINLVNWYEGQKLLAVGRKGSDYSPETFQGYHAEYLLIIIDEACGIVQGLWDSVESLATSENSRILAIGNPDNPSSAFAEACSSDMWHRIRISAFDTPNMTGESVPDEVARKLVTRQWVDDAARRWGPDSPLYISKVLAQFPSHRTDGIIWRSHLLNSINVPAASGVHFLGLDVGGTGGDRTVLRERIGNRLGREWIITQTDAALQLEELESAIAESGATDIWIDTIGVGYGIKGGIDRAIQAKRLNIRTHAFVASEKANDEKRFVNRRAEMWWNMREICESGRLSTVFGQLDEDLIEELTEPKYFEKKGRVQVEPKEDVAERIGRSPDRADALLQAFYRNEAPVMKSFGSTIAAARMPLGRNR